MRRGCRSINRQPFPYPVFGRFAYTLSALNVHYLACFLCQLFSAVMSAHIIQSVRKQPDTGYRKWLPVYAATAPYVRFGDR